MGKKSDPFYERSLSLASLYKTIKPRTNAAYDIWRVQRAQNPAKNGRTNHKRHRRLTAGIKRAIQVPPDNKAGVIRVNVRRHAAMWSEMDVMVWPVVFKWQTAAVAYLCRLPLRLTVRLRKRITTSNQYRSLKMSSTGKVSSKSTHLFP